MFNCKRILSLFLILLHIPSYFLGSCYCITFLKLHGNMDFNRLISPAIYC